MRLNPLRKIQNSLSFRLLLLTVLPLLLTTIILTSYTIHSRRVEVESSLQSVGKSTVEYLATISDFAIYSGNKALLDNLAASANRIANVHSVAFFDADRDLLASTPEYRHNTSLGNSSYLSSDGQLIYFERPVLAIGVEVSDYLETGDYRELSEAPIGWVVLAIDRSASISKGQAIIRTNLLIGLSLFCLTAIIAFYLARTVVTPLNRISRAVRAIEQGDLETRITPSTHDELAELALGINHLAKSVAASRVDMEQQIDTATQRLQLTLEDIREKNRELERARSEAEAASRAKGDFLAQMSHELRTPITAIQGFIRLLGESQLSRIENRYCTIIDQAARQLLLLIDDILSITRLQSRNLSLEIAPLSIIECVESPVSMMAPSAHHKGLELILDIFPDVPVLIEGDSLRIRQILYNLLSNAIKFTDFGHIIVRLQKLNTADDASALAIQIQDTGIGIPEKVRKQIFEPFAQADNSISRRYGGSGLGLAIVKNLVGLMNGTIRVESQMSRGTTFNVILPLEQPEASAIPDRAAIFPGRVLLLDPNPVSRQALEHLLTRFVEKLESCETLAEAHFEPDDGDAQLVLYSAPIQQQASQRLAELHSLRAATEARIVVVAGLESPGAGIDAEVLETLHPISFVGRPPTLTELNVVLADTGSHAAKLQAGKTNLSSLSVLVAEDNAFNCLLLETLLTRAGAHCDLAENGAKAIELANKVAYDIILLDVHMPEKNGIEVVKSIRANGGRNRNTPVLMLTADVLQQEEEELFNAGANDLLFKPLNEQRLFSCLQKLTDNPVPLTPTGNGGSAALPQTLFLNEIRKLANAAADARSSGNDEVLRDNIHQLLGIAGVYQMQSLERAVRQVHICLKKGNAEITEAAMESLEMEISLLEAAACVGASPSVVGDSV